MDVHMKAMEGGLQMTQNSVKGGMRRRNGETECT